MLDKPVVMRRLNWFLPKPAELRDQGLYFVIALLLMTFVTAVLGGACKFLEANVPAYLMLLHTASLSMLLMLVRKSRTENQFTALVYVFITGVG
jgi:hypothetical protein